ncbi:hypothetical protein LCGC14_1204770, partial [marine sediment metagenome]
LWAAEKVSVDRQLLVAAACDCAELALPYVPSDEDRPRIAIETARKWIRGEATLEEVRAAAYAASASAASASSAAYAAYAASAAYAYDAASTDAAYAASDAASAASAASSASSAASYASSAASYASAYASASARETTHRQCADIVRKHIPWEIVAELGKRVLV